MTSVSEISVSNRSATTPAPPKAGRAFLVERNDLAKVRWQTVEEPPLAQGEVLLRHDRFAFTANNMTYAKFGDAIDYWRYFPASAPWGQIPVWGLGTIAKSRHPELAEGERVYGYFPMASQLRVAPGRLKATGFVDTSEHRATLPVTYNEYLRIDRDPSYDHGRTDQHLVLRPLFALSYFMAEYLKEEALFGARQVVISSASSKTALGLAFLLREARGAGSRLVGLTSRGNADFVRRTGHYDDVVGYEAIATLATDVPSIFIDIAGDAAVRRGVHGHLREALAYSGRVGATHWQSEEAEEDLPGAKPQWFFTPTHIVKRRAEWGPQLLRERLQVAWTAFLRDADRWLRITTGTGEAAIEAAYRDVLTGRVPPEQAHTLTFR